MFDCHADLLTYVYINRNDIQKIRKVCYKIYNEKNINGAIFNLFFMSEIEMEEELGIKKDEIDVINMLKIADNILKENDILPKSMEYFYGIEGLDYLNDISDIDELYDIGLRSTNIIWNNENKFGGGIKSKAGLSTIGEYLVEKLVRKGIIIDLSHANYRTFFDIINKCKDLKRKGLNPKVFASHSNLKAICDEKRNLSDEQVLAIKDLDGIIGIVEYKKFISNNGKYEEDYLNNILYLRELFGGIQNISVSTDDEIFYNNVLENSNLYNSYEVKEKIEVLLKSRLSSNEVNNILYDNAIRFMKK